MIARAEGHFGRKAQHDATGILLAQTRQLIGVFAACYEQSIANVQRGQVARSRGRDPVRLFKELALAAVAGLEKIASGRALEALVKAVRDEEWWVRNAAAKAIVNIDFQLVYVEKVLSGYDKYAADAVKNALYKQINMNGGGFR